LRYDSGIFTNDCYAQCTIAVTAGLLSRHDADIARLCSARPEKTPQTRHRPLLRW
jgi:hypothetical protein